MKDDCLFCKIIKGEVPSKKLYEDEDIIIILDAYPEADGHSLVIPKKHYEDIYEVPNDVLLKMIEIGKKEATKIIAKLDKNSLSFLVNYGEDQAIKHIHLHLIPEFIHRKCNLTTDEVIKILSEE